MWLTFKYCDELGTVLYALHNYDPLSNETQDGGDEFDVLREDEPLERPDYKRKDKDGGSM